MLKNLHLTYLLVSLFILGGCSLNQRKLTFDNLSVTYTGSVTRVEAAKLGAFLKMNGFSDMETHLQLDKEGLDYLIKWGVDKSFSLNDPRIKKLQKLEQSLPELVFDGQKVILYVSEPDFTSCRAVNESMGKTFQKNGNTLFYLSPVRRRQARRVHNILVEEGFFKEGNKLAQLERHGDAYYCRLEIPDWQRETEFKLVWAEKLRQKIEDSLFDHSLVTIEFCNRMLKTEKKIEGDPYKNVMDFHLDKIMYSDQILPRDIRKLGDYLQRVDLFMNQGKEVKVLQKGETYQVTFRAKYGVDDRSAINDAQLLSADLSKNVFRGSPVYVHIYDYSKKQKVIHSTMVY